MVKFKEGLYYVGDLCYVLCAEHWELCKYKSGVFRVSHHKCWTHDTRHGDGKYNVTVDRIVIGSVGVDSGTLGICPIEVCNNEKLQQIRKLKLGFVSEFSDPFNVSHNNGIFNLDTFKISTNSYSE
jgi:hypothetical protein